jgi:hypothetical protein
MKHVPENQGEGRRWPWRPGPSKAHEAPPTYGQLVRALPRLFAEDLEDRSTWFRAEQVFS